MSSRHHEQVVRLHSRLDGDSLKLYAITAEPAIVLLKIGFEVHARKLTSKVLFKQARIYLSGRLPVW
jgi:hypothetical protein